MLTIQLPEELEERLDTLARQSGRDKNAVVQEALSSYLEDLEDLLIAEERVADIRAGRVKTYSLEEVERDLGLAD